MRRTVLNTLLIPFGKTLLIAFVVGSAVYGTWLTRDFVSAYLEVRHVYVFGTDVVPRGWNNPDAILTQDVSATGALSSFTQTNSAFLSFVATQVSSPVDVIEPQLPVEELVPTPDEQVESQPEQLTEPIPEAVPEVVPEATAPDAAPEVVPETVAPDAAQEVAPAPSAPESFLNLLLQFAARRTQLYADAAVSDETGSTTDSTAPVPVVEDATPTPSVVEDVALCTILGRDCYTLEVSGFSISGELVQTEFKEARVAFSFAGLAGTDTTVDDKLLVRYYHAGAWRQAGEIFLNKEISNGSNGAYFESALPDIERWEDLSDVRVVIEYARENQYAAAELYVDAVWITTDYQERAQDILSGSADQEPVVPKNVAFGLSEGGGEGLTLDTGETIAFPFSDDVDEDTLHIRADKKEYLGQSKKKKKNENVTVEQDGFAYVSISNTESVADNFTLAAAFPSGAGTLVSAEQYKRNIPKSSVVTTEVQDVTYFCESQWVAGDAGAYQCGDTTETHVCATISTDGVNCLVTGVSVAQEEQVVYESAWVAIPIAQASSTDTARTSALAVGFDITATADQTFEILPGQTLYFRFMFDTEDTDEQRFALYAFGATLFGDLDSTQLLREARLSTQKKLPDTERTLAKQNTRVSNRTNFEGDETPAFKFKFKSQRGVVTRFADRLLGRGGSFKVSHTKLVDPKGVEGDVPVAIEYQANGEWTLALKKQPHAFRPGKYTIEFTVQDGGATYIDSVEFYWGVLAVNTDQSVYEPGDVVALSIGVIDDLGNTICDAELELAITTPGGIRTVEPVTASEECGPNNIISVPDYASTYAVSEQGRYAVELTEFDSVGAVLHRITDAFVVQEELPFVVTRTGPTRIYPKAPYTMTLAIEAREDFSGIVRDSVPLGTILTETGGADIRQFGDALHLEWPVTLTAGQSRTLTYTFDAPDISPYLYLFGPARLYEGAQVRFEELRSWKVASDALGGYTEKMSTWSPVTGNVWEVKDLSGSPFNVPANAVLEIGIINSDTANERVGGVRHASSSLTRSLQLQEAEPQGTTMATMHVQASATSSIQTFGETTGGISFVLLGYWSDGYYQERFQQIDPNITAATWGFMNLGVYGVRHRTIAEMVVGNWDTGAQLLGGIRQASSSLNRYTDIHESEANGVNTVTMLVTASTTGGIVEAYAQTEGANNASIDYWLAGYWSVNPTGLEYNERFDDLSGPASGSTWTDRALDSFTVPPTGIADVIFANAADANLSQLLGVRANGSTLDRSINLHEAEAGGWVIGRTHVTAGSDASSTIEYFTDDTANDQFRLLGYWAADDYPAAVPTLYNEPFDNQKMGSSTPTFRFSSTDPDGASGIVYEIEWDDDAALDASPLGSYASDSDAGFVDVTSGDTSPFTEGDQIRFTIPSSLVSGTTYYWRVRAIDVNGSNIPSEWTDVQSFTYVANTDPAQWYQTQDTQFEAGTLSGVETDGSNAVVLSDTPPTGALIVYGVSTDTTPRYRVWSGAAWGSPASAQNVGGTAQWVVTKAGTTRNEYVAATQDALADVNVQVYDADLGTWGDLQEVTTGVSDITARGVDVAYETTSGDALVVFCDGDADPGYYVWNGTGWTGPTSINLGSANNCEYIKLASNPVSDEIVLVARDTGTQYEAQVWDGSAWSNSVVLGSMNQVAHEGIAVEYEESGNQAMVAVSNGTNGNFAWAAWDSDTDLWSTPTTQTIGNDFEAGMIARDSGTDRLVLCYADEDDDLGSLIWDGDGWATFVAGTNEFETTGTTNTRGGAGTIEGRPVSCQFETTTGRDGNALMVYSDNTAGRYRTWTGSSHVAEASVSSVQDSWTVASIRTGAGIILSLFHDDINGRYDFSSWDGSAWSVLQTLENSPSVTAAPFNEAYGMAAQVYQSNSGTITSDPIAFTLVPSQLTWGEILWNTTEPTGTDVEVQVLYETGGTCTTLVPDVDLPGNSGGFQLSASPLNISSLSTSTYDGLCLRATLSSTNTNLPTLNEWTLSWEREPYLSQAHYRWYVNVNGATPTDPWGTPDIAEDTAISGSGEPSYGNELRLRMSLAVSNVTLSASSLSLKLQYAADTSCDADSSWLDVGAISSTTAAWRGFNNGAVSDGSTLVSALLTGSDVLATYEEENDSAVNPSSATAGQELEWDWVLEHNGAAGTTYCFRTITADGEVLNAYDRYPTLTTNDKPNAPSLEKPFDNEAVASTTPWFEFVADDNEGDDVTYQVQVDDAYDFGSALIDRDSQTNFDEFSNVVTTADKDPFTSGQTVRFIPTTALTNNTTYYWRVRAKDRNNSNSWSDWSDINSVTASTSVPYSMWHQTRYEQFLANTHDDTEATSTNDVVLTPPQLTGTSTGATIDFDWKSSGNAWGELSWSDNEATGDIRYRLEYYTGTAWLPIPNADLPGNGAGFGSGPVSLLALSPTTYNQIRPTAHLTNIGGTPRLLDWTVTWDLAVSEPTLIDLFDNEKTGTTTPTFTFYSTDPESNDIRYEISWSQTTDFTASTTRQSGINAGFTNTASSTDASPFVSGDTISFKVQAGDVLTNGTTYWWRVRARDPAGGDAWSTWSESRSFTVDTAVTVSTWFQTTDEQFDIDTLTDTETYGSDAVRISTIIREAFTAYAEGTTQVPRFKIWNGSAWSTEGSGVTTGNVIRFVEAAPAPTRDEYAVATINASADADVQIYNGTTDTFGNIAEIDDGISDILSHGVDVAYESDSGDLVAVSCDGTEAVYRVWNGSSWSATSSISLLITGNCEWIRLASDPATDEIVMVVRNDITGGVDYQALVWNGSSWGNSVFFGSQATANDEGMAVEYEESGAEAVVVVANGTNASFLYDRWNGSGWVGSTTVAIGNDLGGAQFARDDGTDRLALCYVDIDSDIGFVEWSGSGWNGFQEFEAQANTTNGFNARPVSCQFETEGSRDGYLMMPFSDDIDVQYSEWTGIGAPTVPVTISTITDSWEVRTTRTGDGNVLGLFYDDATTDYDFSYWNGTQWSTEEILESTSIATLTPSPVPFDIVSRLYPSFTSGTVVGASVDFDDGTGPKWDEVSWSDSTPGSSNILYQVEYYSTTTDTWSLISDTEIPDNSTGTTTAPIDIGNLSRIIYNQIRVVANLSCVLGICPTVSDWTVSWSEGITLSGTAKAYDQSTNLTSGTVAVAVNGTIQTGKTATISAGTWSIANVTVFDGDVVTVFIDGVADSNEAAAVTKYDGVGDITGMQLAERHLTIGSVDAQTISNTDLGQYDNSVSGDEDVFFDVDAGNDLAACFVGGCADVEMVILAANTYRPDSASSGAVVTHDMEINGTLTADGNTLSVTGSWDNNSAFTANTSTVVFTATSTTETIDSTGASTASFNAVTFGQTSGTATWTLSSALDVNGNLGITYGTLSMNGLRAINIAGNLTIGASGLYTKGTATTTFDGTGSSTWTDSTVAKQDMGIVVVDGTSKTVLLGGSVKATDVTIGADDILNVNGAYTFEVIGNWTNNNVFTAQTGTVSFIATTTGKIIAPGSSSFYNLTFNGVNGNWAFSSSAVTVSNNFTIATGTVSLPTATTTVAGNFANTGGTFMHNNGAVSLTGTTAKTIQSNASNFYDLSFDGSGSWTFSDGNATSSRHFTINTGTVTLPSGTLSVGGNFARNGGTLTHNSGVLKFIATTARTIYLNGTSVFTLRFDGSGGSWSFIDTSVTAVDDVIIVTGTLTAPSTGLTIGGSFSNAGTFTSNAGTVTMNSTDSGETIDAGTSDFYNLTLAGTGGGWTITQNATTTNNFTLTTATAFTLTSAKILTVGGTFTNSVGGAATTWTGSTLVLNSGTSYSINTKVAGNDAYGTLQVNANTDIKSWNSSASTTNVSATGSWYSQDHAGVDGDLYVYGEYVHSSGTDYWSYATDFDGTALGGSSRQVDVFVATSSSLTFSAGTLNIIGAAGATTTVQHNGSTATYSFTVSGGTLNASYYALRHLDASGLNLSGTPTITSLSNGDFELYTNAGTMLTVAGTVIDANIEKQIQLVNFSTSTGITSGTNVTASGSPTSYWWFRNHYGNYDGEAYDSDPTGNPGNVRWDDSAFAISVSGTVYSDRGTTPMGSPVCDNTTPVVTVVVDGGSTYSAFCNSGNGQYTVSGVSFIGDVVLTVYLNGAAQRAVTVTQTPTGNLTGVDLYAKALIVRHEDTSPLTIADLAVFDSTDDPDVFFTAATGSPNTLVVQPENELYVWYGKSFAPAGNVTVQSGGSGSARDGSLYIASTGTFTAAGTESHSLGGSLTVGTTTATFTPANSTLTFTATTTGKSISAAAAFSLYNVTFNGSGGGWSFDNTATTTIQNDFVVTTGTVSGTGNIKVSAGDITGSGTITMTGGTVQFETSGSFGANAAWQFNNLTIGDGFASGITTHTNSGTTTVTGILRVAASQTLNAGSAPWVLSGSGTPLTVSGTFDAQTAPFSFTGTAATLVADEAFAVLNLVPSSGTPTYTLQGGTLSTANFNIGSSGSTVSVTANTNDPSITTTGTLTISSGSTFSASNTGALQIGGSFVNAGTFTHNNGTVTMNSTDTGESITPGSSSFYALTLNGVGGGWTITDHATTTSDFSITNAASVTLTSGKVFAVGGTFTNGVGGSATTWTGSTLYLNSGTAYSINTKIAGGDVYGTLQVGPNTDIKSWNSSASTATVASSGSWYSQDHAAVDGDLYVYGEYVHSTGSDYWSYATDFDGTALTGGQVRGVDVFVASSSSLTFSGGVFDIIGTSSATTTIQNQGVGAYSFAVSGGTFNAQYYSVKNVDSAGLALSGTPTVTTLSNGAYELNVTGGSMLTIAGSVITQNPLKIFSLNSFATSTGVITGSNVTVTGTTASSWKFNLHYGTYDGEAYDTDPAGDPGYARWDDSASAISISGNVYSDEGVTASSVCDGSTAVVRLKVEGAGSYSAFCTAGTGAYTITGVNFNPGDVLTVFLDTAGGRQAANISVDPLTTITDMHLYENRVIVRHEDTAPLTIADMAVYDSSDDSDIPFTAVDAGTDTLTLPAERKLIVWTGKTFAPAGNMTLLSGGSGNAWDGTLELQSSATFTASGSQTHSVGGSLTVGTGATLTPASSTFTFTATTTGKVITSNSSSFYNMTFNGTGGNWAFAGGSATSTNDFTITNGTVTLPSVQLSVGGSFTNTGGTFMHNNGALVLASTATGKSVYANGSNFYDLTLNGSGGAWTFTDTVATTSNNFTITVGSTTLPSTRFVVGGSFINSGGSFNHNGSAVTLTATASGKFVTPGASSFSSLRFNGSGGGWTMGTATTTVVGNVTIQTGTVAFASGDLRIGGSFSNAGTFTSNSGTVTMNSTDTGETIDAGTSDFYNLTLAGTGGGWTITQNATTTNNFTLTTATAFTLTSAKILTVGGTFTNSVGGAATTWTGSTLVLNSGTSYSINTKVAGNDAYGTLQVNANTDIKSWNSSASTTNVSATGSWYSQDHAAVDGDLYVYGEYVHSSGTDYWSYATDFDGTALGGSSRQVDVFVATSSSLTFSAGTLNIIGAAGATTTVQHNGSTATYSFTVSGGTLNASYYALRHLDASGLNLSGTPTITSLSNGDFELYTNAGTMLTVASTTIDANASKQIDNVRFSTSTGITSGYNATLSGTPVGAWNFNTHYGNYDGEAYDSDGGDSCGFIRWDDSSCLFVSQEHYRFRNDDGGEGAPDSEWYNASWSKRKIIAIANNTATTYTNIPIEVPVTYDGDMQSDFDDLRFTSSDGTTLISHWIESRTASTNATVWVEVPTLTASGDAFIYMYYGNGAVADAGDGSTTFGFFDDFEDDNISEYSGNTTLFDVDTTFNYTGTYGLDAGTNVDQRTTNGIYRTGSLASQGETIRFFQYIDTTADDEPCAFFGVQGSGTNYAVCLDQYPSEKVIIAEDVESNDGSGTVLASTTVSYTTGWYEVEIDWLTSNVMNVTVYDSLGAEFATTTATDSSHTSGGIGFGFWGQHGGWDYIASRDYTSTDPSVTTGPEQTDGGATWYAAEDTNISGVTVGEDIRLRFSIQNSGSAIFGQLFRLQYAQKGVAASCEAVPSVSFNDVPTVSGGCGSSPACVMTSTQFADGAATTPLLTYPAAFTYAAGGMVESPSNQTSSTTVPHNGATEVEYTFQLTANATSDAYCFRTTDGGIELDNYERTPEITLTFPPVLSGFTLNNDFSIGLTEGATTTIYATSTVTDNNGYDDISYATSTIYRSGVGPLCTADTNNCYQVTSSQCSLTNCSGNSCVVQCSADIEYYADATDSGTYAGETWLAGMSVQDLSGLRDTQTTAVPVELLTLYGLSVDASINYGSLEVGSTTGATNQQTTVVNTGNSNIDIQLQGTDLAGTGSTIPVGEQKFATTTFTYASCSICTFLTGSATNFEVDLPKPTSTTSPSTDDLYWGINVPNGTGAVSHTGTNTFWATSD
jgi:hypothetical protein